MIKSKKPPKPLKRTPLKRTPIKRKPFPNRKLETESGLDEPKVLKYTLPTKSADPQPVKYVRPPKEVKEKKKPKAIRQIGKKTTEWDVARAELKKHFELAGIVSCQLRWKGCWVNNALSFAHRLKRRFITDEEELRIVGLVCIPCHNLLEPMPSEKMYQIVTDLHKEFLTRFNKKYE